MKKMKFENSKFDNDKGVKEGSAADKKRDASEKAGMKKKGVMPFAKGGIVPAAKMTDKSGVSAAGDMFAKMNTPKQPNTGRNQMVGGPGMPRLAKGGMLKGKKK